MFVSPTESFPLSFTKVGTESIGGTQFEKTGGETRSANSPWVGGHSTCLAPSTGDSLHYWMTIKNYFTLNGNTYQCNILCKPKIESDYFTKDNISRTYLHVYI